MRGNKSIGISTRDASSTSITTSYSELTASVGEDVSRVLITGNFGALIIFGIGASGSEVDYFTYNCNASLVQDGPFELLIPKGSRISIKTATGTVASGLLHISYFN